MIEVTRLTMGECLPWQCPSKSRKMAGPIPLGPVVWLLWIDDREKNIVRRTAKTAHAAKQKGERLFHVHASEIHARQLP